jgi:DNA polymerase sigma
MLLPNLVRMAADVVRLIRGAGFRADAVRWMARVFRRAPSTRVETVIANARVPLVRVLVSIPGAARIPVDVSMTGNDGVLAADVVSTLVRSDARIQPLAIWLKHVAGQMHVLGAAHGFPSSHVYACTLLAFLQRCSPPLVPLISPASEGPCFDQRPSRLDGSSSARRPAANSTPIGTLAIRFCEFMANHPWDRAGLSLSSRDLLRVPPGTVMYVDGTCVFFVQQ